eukprot:TRINITY_DN6400_c0_g1_i1.p1 TRINITY_DN6400_c0_g1~~TRINITY_DN6400_c0_g1_i1.p1  ORF type:complete len:502 (+),score=76.02 TRINITY_DN6400_c0_g1_i1:174-1679(+)
MTLLILVASIFFAFIVVLASVPFVRYYSRKSLYAKLPRYNAKKSNSWMPTALLMQPDGFFKIMDSFRDEDGKMMPIMHWGPNPDGTHAVCVTDAAAVREILLNDDIYVKHPLIYEPVSRILGNGVITASGDYWKMQRRLLTPVFHFGTLKAMIPDMAEEGELLIQDIRARRARSPYVDLVSVLNNCTLSVIIRLGFGKEFDVEWTKNQWRNLNDHLTTNVVLHSVFGNALKHLPFPFVQKFNAANNNIRHRAKEAIRRRREQGTEGTDLLSLMLKAERDFPEKVTEDLIVDECMTFLLAGQDTTAGALSWAVYFLSLYPEAQQKLREEIDLVLQDRLPTESDLPKLKYLRQVMDESLRLRPLTPTLTRLLTEGRELCGHVMPKGTMIVAAFAGVSTCEKYWENPQVFDPERFSESSKQEGRHPFSSIPFSAGNRNCIGQKFAVQEFTILLAMLTQNFIFELEPDHKFVVKYEAVPVPTGLKVKFTDRKWSPRQSDLQSLAN